MVELTLIDRYLLREWFSLFALVLAATIGLLLMQSLYDDFRDITEAGAGLSDVVVYFAIRLPSFFSVVLPLALLVSLLYVLGQLHRNNEIVAMRAAGLSVGRITRVVWIAGVLLCGVSWCLNASVIPWSVETSRSLLESLQYREQARTTSADRVGVKTSVAFDNQRQNRMWFMNRYSQFTQKGYGVSVTELDGDRREKTRIFAREGWLDPQRGYWVFRDGREVWYDVESGETMRTVPFVEKAIPHFREDPALMLVFDRKPGDLSFLELRTILNYFAQEENPKVNLYATRYYGLLADTLGPLIVIVIAIPFAVAGVRVNPAVGVSKALGLFVLYFILVRASYALGGRAVIDPLYAAILPNFMMLAIGGIFFLRVR